VILWRETGLFVETQGSLVEIQGSLVGVQCSILLSAKLR